MDHLAQGLVEVKGLVAAIEAADAMSKAADVRVSRAHKSAPCTGDIAACRAAVDAAVGALPSKDMLLAVNVLPSPAGGTEETERLLDEINAKKAAKVQRRTAG